MIVVAKKLSVLQLFISRMPKTCADFTISAMGDELTQNKSEQHICGRESLLREKDVQFFNLT